MYKITLKNRLKKEEKQMIIQDMIDEMSNLASHNIFNAKTFKISKEDPDQSTHYDILDKYSRSINKYFILKKIREIFEMDHIEYLGVSSSRFMMTVYGRYYSDFYGYIYVIVKKDSLNFVKFQNDLESEV